MVRDLTELTALHRQLLIKWLGVVEGVAAQENLMLPRQALPVLLTPLLVLALLAHLLQEGLLAGGPEGKDLEALVHVGQEGMLPLVVPVILAQAGVEVEGLLLGDRLVLVEVGVEEGN